MSWAIHSNDGRPFGAILPDYPPPFRYPVPGYVQAIRNALWSIEIGLGGQVDWHASFGDRQSSVGITTAAAVHGPQFRRHKTRKRAA